jgi:hypothetical protein
MKTIALTQSDPQLDEKEKKLALMIRKDIIEAQQYRKRRGDIAGYLTAGSGSAILGAALYEDNRLHGAAIGCAAGIAIRFVSEQMQDFWGKRLIRSF